MPRPPPTSTLFPYTTLFRSRWPDPHAWPVLAEGRDSGARSEEHTSELQSHLKLVCRLLLEKKNIKVELHALSDSKYGSEKVEGPDIVTHKSTVVAAHYTVTR